MLTESVSIVVQGLAGMMLVATATVPSFWFGSFTLQYALVPERAIVALHDSEILADRLMITKFEFGGRNLAPR